MAKSRVSTPFQQFPPFPLPIMLRVMRVMFHTTCGKCQKEKTVNGSRLKHHPHDPHHPHRVLPDQRGSRAVSFARRCTPDSLKVLDELGGQDPDIEATHLPFSLWFDVFGDEAKTAADAVAAGMETKPMGIDYMQPELRDALQLVCSEKPNTMRLSSRAVSGPSGESSDTARNDLDFSPVFWPLWR